MQPTAFNPLPSGTSPTVQLGREELLHHFEAAWRSGTRPSLYEYLAQLSDEERNGALRELLRCDSNYRRKAGETPKAADYTAILPDAAELIEVILSESLGETVAPPDGMTNHPTVIGANPAEPASTLSTPSDTSQAPLSGSMAVGIGSTIGPYELIGKLGEGGMGAVYKARHQHLDMLVAIKVLPQQFTQQPESVSRFKREMKAVGRIRHPNIVQAMDAGEIDGTHFLAMEYIEGSDLAKLVAKKGVFSIANACKAIKQAAQALSSAHAAGLVHRDIKPSNLLVAKSGQIKILDLGLALLGEDSGRTSEVTAHGQTFGTPDYMAPEQWADSHAVDARTDLYALGCTLFFLLVGRAPYADERHRTPLNKMTGHVLEPIPDLKSARKDVPDNIIAIYLKLMAKKPGQRYQTAAELVEDLNRHAAGKSLVENPSSLLIASTVNDIETNPSPTLLTSGAIEDAATTQPVIPKTRRWGYAKLWAGIAIAALLVTLLINWIGKPKSGEIAETDTNASPDSQPSTINVPADGSVKHVENTGWHGWPADAPKPAIAPFDADQAKKHQEEWAAYLKVPVEWENSIGMKFRLIPPGEFLMGMSQEEAEAVAAHSPKSIDFGKLARSSAPEHAVQLTQPYYLGTFEITQAQFERVTGSNPSHFSSSGEGKEQVQGQDTGQHPVEYVQMVEIAKFAIKLSEVENLKPSYFTSERLVTPLSGDGYRLPSEAEWEFACRSGINGDWYPKNQDRELSVVGWFQENSGKRTHPVGQLQENGFGLFDMQGNVWEFCQDWYDPLLYEQRSSTVTVDPTGPASGTLGVARGGHFLDGAATCGYAFRRVAGRDDYRSPSLTGFRLVLGIDAVRHRLSEKANSAWHNWPADAPRPAIAPFDADQAKKHQEEWAAYLKVPVEWENSIGMKFRLIPPGEFLMGSTPEEIEAAKSELTTDPELTKIFHTAFDTEAPQHRVILTRPFYASMTETRQRDYFEVMGENPSAHAPTGTRSRFVEGLDTSMHPVENVAWNQAAQFCERLSSMEGLATYYTVSDENVVRAQGLGYRLPTEAEWEYSTRAGSTTRYWFGNVSDKIDEVAWSRRTSGHHTHPVQELLANPFGLFDNYGNVAEWCDDIFENDSYSHFKAYPAINPVVTGTLQNNMVRGGAIHSYSPVVRSAFRDSYPWSGRADGVIGFRTVLSVDAVRQSLKVEDWIQLFNGKDLTGWKANNGGPPQWVVKDGYLESVKGTQSIQTERDFPLDFELHAEFWIARQPDVQGQWRGNSGIFLLGRHEIQIHDAFENPENPKVSIGALYGVIAPTEPQILPPETWQTFDVSYRSPRVDETGKITTPGSLSLLQNDKPIIVDVPFSVASTTSAFNSDVGQPGPIVLQMRSSIVRFRNLRLRPLPAK